MYTLQQREPSQDLNQEPSWCELTEAEPILEDIRLPFLRRLASPKVPDVTVCEALGWFSRHLEESRGLWNPPALLQKEVQAGPRRKYRLDPERSSGSNLRFVTYEVGVSAFVLTLLELQLLTCRIDSPFPQPDSYPASGPTDWLPVTCPAQQYDLKSRYWPRAPSITLSFHESWVPENCFAKIQNKSVNVCPLRVNWNSTELTLTCVYMSPRTHRQLRSQVV